MELFSEHLSHSSVNSSQKTHKQRAELRVYNLRPKVLLQSLIPTTSDHNNDAVISEAIDSINSYESSNNDDWDLNDNVNLSSGSNIKLKITAKTKIESKRRRNSGKSYISSSGNLVPKRKCTRLTDCRVKCRKMVTNEDQLLNYRAYWNLGSYEKRVAHFKQLIEIVNKSRTRKRNNASCSRVREFSRKYHVMVKSRRIQVCQRCFLNTFGETRGALTTILKKARITTAVNDSEDRKRRHVLSSKLPTLTIDNVNAFIDSFPHCEK